MKAIFYDIETSDKEPVSQIINYSFIAVDDAFTPVAECSGDIRLSRLQLPSPEAILTNRVDVLALQESDAPHDGVAMRRIADFVAEVQRGEKSSVPLIGYNSNKFDLLRLRTSMIRNGINPYFSGKVLYRDVFQAIRVLAMRDESFPLATKVSERNGDTVRTLSLEAVTRSLDLLTGPQSHNSRDDVLLTIELAKLLKSRFKLDIRTFDAFELAAWVRSQKGAGLFWNIEPEYEIALGQRIRRTAMAFHNATHRYALFIDLASYLRGEGRRCLRWYNMSTSPFFSGGEIAPDETLKQGDTSETVAELARRAREEFKKINSDNFFADSTCDIEQDIYRVDFKGLDALEAAIWKNDASELQRLKHRDLSVLYTRYRLSVTPQLDAQGRELLKKYALYRYGGKLRLSKSDGGTNSGGVDKGSANSADTNSKDTGVRYHPTLREMLDAIETLSTAAREQALTDDMRLLSQLRKYYVQSEIMEVAGEELLADTPSKTKAA